MSKRTSPLVIAIAGGTGSGKTTVANVILKRAGAHNIAYLAHDAYYKDLKDLPAAQRERINFDHPNSLDTDLLIQHVRELKANRPIALPVYDFKTHSRTQETVPVEPQPIIIVEGILIFVEPRLRDLFDVKIYVDTDPDIRFIHQYLNTVRPMHQEFVEPSKRYSDVIIPEGGFNTVALDMVVARVEALLHGERVVD